MCAQVGVIFGTKRRRSSEQEHLSSLFGWLFTYLLLLSERRGPHATGVALLKSSGEHLLFKRPLRASEFIKDQAFREVLSGVDSRSTLLMGHTRWQTKGDASDNRNNHPIRAGEVVGTHNGDLANADALFEQLDLPRFAEVDSEIIFRMADATMIDGRIDVKALKEQLVLCQGSMSAVLASKLDPKTIVIVKGNKPLALRYHGGHRAIIYASDAVYLDVVLAGDTAWKALPVVPMSMSAFRCDDLLAFDSLPFSLRRAPTNRRGAQR